MAARSRTFDSAENILVVLLLGLVSGSTGTFQLPIHEKPERPRLLASDGVPFVPEDFRDYSNIIFNKIDFRELTTMTPDNTDGLESALLQMIKNETEVNVEAAPDEVSFCLFLVIDTFFEFVILRILKRPQKLVRFRQKITLPT